MILEMVLLARQLPDDLDAALVAGAAALRCELRVHGDPLAEQGDEEVTVEVALGKQHTLLQEAGLKVPARFSAEIAVYGARSGALSEDLDGVPAALVVPMRRAAARFVIESTGNPLEPHAAALLIALALRRQTDGILRGRQGMVWNRDRDDRAVAAELLAEAKGFDEWIKTKAPGAPWPSPPDRSVQELRAHAWLAVRCEAIDPIVEALARRRKLERVPLRQALEAATIGRRELVFVGPVQGWVLVFGDVGSDDRIGRALSSAHGEVQRFLIHDRRDTFGWTRYLDGRQVRSAAIVGRELLSEGEPWTGADPPELDPVFGNDVVLDVAAAWSVDLRALLSGEEPLTSLARPRRRWFGLLRG